MNMQMSVFEIPNGVPVMSYKSYIMAALVMLGVILISYLSCRKILRENAAETLRSKIPSFKRNSLNITRTKIFNNMKFATKWNIRDILRNKMRTLMGLAGVIGCCMLIVCALGMLDSMNHFVDLQFRQLYNFEYKLALKNQITPKDADDLMARYGNKTSKTLGIEIEKDGKREANNIVVTDAGNYLRFVDRNDNYVKINSGKGVYITSKLAENKGYQKGDKIKWHIYGDKKFYTSKIVGFNKDPQNQNVTMTKKYLESLGIKYIPDAIYTNKNLKKVTSIKNVDSIQDRDKLKEGMNDMLSMMRGMIILIIIVAIALGAIIIVNLGTLSFTEKQYQFATLKVLGFKDKQIKKIFIKQNNWIAVLSIFAGCPLGFYLTDWLFKNAIEEHYDFGASIKIATYVFASIGTFVISYVVSKFLSRKVRKIDMVTSLKGNE